MSSFQQNSILNKDGDIYDRLNDLLHKDLIKTPEFIAKTAAAAKKETGSSDTGRNDRDWRSNSRCKELMKLLPFNPKVEQYLDVGCAGKNHNVQKCVCLNWSC